MRSFSGPKKQVPMVEVARRRLERRKAVALSGVSLRENKDVKEVWRI
jgi:hypothetical protein